ncbi:hypothetical protein [Streptomyces sp. CC224B]|uniref:hypothetical protein n=1 Tax=Streptomyces sp. CC224B TaxID=3044571 RepID=UPI0024A8C04B|nr:hypothetical protein [Streptomyces sp. CC224B]
MNSPDVVARLLLATVEHGPALTVPQAQGNACIWCPTTLHTGKGISLGGDAYWCPHACPPCHAARTQVIATYADWNDHLLTCTTCLQGAPCDSARTLREAHVQARTAVGRPSVWCMNCLTIMRPGAVWEPHLWQSRRGPELDYRHTGSCSPRSRPSEHEASSAEPDGIR